MRSGPEYVDPAHFLGNRVQAIIGCPANRFLNVTNRQCLVNNRLFFRSKAIRGSAHGTVVEQSSGLKMCLETHLNEFVSLSEGGGYHFPSYGLTIFSGSIRVIVDRACASTESLP